MTEIDDQAPATAKRGIAFGGGGLWFLAWTLTYCAAAEAVGIPLSKADLTVGTSAGSMSGGIVRSGAIAAASQQFQALAAHPDALRQMLAQPAPVPSQERAAQVIGTATGTDPASIQTIGRAAMAAHNPSPDAYVASVRQILGGIQWPAGHHITCVDCYTGERIVLGPDSGVPLEVACAASSSLPGLNGPIWVGDQLCMDGGVSHSSTHSDVVATDKVLIISLLTPDSHPSGSFGLAQRTNPNRLNEEIAALEAAGNSALLVCADPPAGINLMDPDAMASAISLAQDRFAETEESLRAFWGS